MALLFFGMGIEELFTTFVSIISSKHLETLVLAELISRTLHIVRAAHLAKRSRCWRERLDRYLDLHWDWKDQLSRQLSQARQSTVLEGPSKSGERLHF